ncbi:hypothetical protein D3C84_716930 [compost metagenome]
MHQDAAGGAADQRRHIGAVVGRRQRRSVGQADAVDKAHVHVDDLEALLVGTTTGNDLGLVVHMAGVPQPIGDCRRRSLRRFSLDHCPTLRDAGRQFMHNAILDVEHPAPRPRQRDMQARAEHLHRFAKALIDATPLQRYFVHARQQPAHQRHQRQHRQKGTAHVAERPDLPQVDAKTVVQFVLQGQQRLRRPAQQIGDDTTPQQRRFQSVPARDE